MLAISRILAVSFVTSHLEFLQISAWGSITQHSMEQFWQSSVLSSAESSLLWCCLLEGGRAISSKKGKFSIAAASTTGLVYDVVQKNVTTLKHRISYSPKKNLTARFSTVFFVFFFSGRTTHCYWVTPCSGSPLVIVRANIYSHIAFLVRGHYY